MLRRHFLQLTAVAPVVGFLPGTAHAYQGLDYAPCVLGDMWKGSKPVIANYTASWSLTCQIKRQIISDLKTDTPTYCDNLVFIGIDWDTYGTSQMAERMNVERRSTLIAFQGETEVARIVAETNPAEIRAFLDTAVRA